jgi:threonine synthase
LAVAAEDHPMNTTAALSGYRCVDCGVTATPESDSRRCEACGGALELELDYAAVDAEPVSGAADALLDRAGLAGLLGVRTRVDLGQGETALLGAPSVADDLGVSGVAVKDEGRNPSGGLVDRELGLAVAAADAAGADTVALPTTGNGGQAAALAAARVGLASHTYAPSRTPFVNKAMINVHGGDMTVVEGRYRDADAAYRGAIADESWYPLAPFATPFRQVGVKPLAYELAAARDWTAPDVVVVPTGQVTAVVGIHRGFRDLVEVGLVDAVPRLVAAQAAGCAPLADAAAAGEAEARPVDHPDTVVGPLEIPDPAGGDLALASIRESGGTAVAVADDEILAGAQALAEAGLPASVTGGAALAAARSIAEAGDLDAAAEVVLVNPVAGSKEADLMRSHLMRQGR